MSAPTSNTSPSDSGQRVKLLDGLTGFRFPIALGIFLIHATHLYNPANNYETPVSPFADQGFAAGLSEFLIPVGLPFLSLFFMLSGFVLTWGWKPGTKPRSFWRRRFFRVFPNHVVTFVLAIILVAGATTNWLPNLLLVHTWDPFEPSGGTNVIVWSLCAEVLFYTLFPFLVGPIQRIADSKLWWWAGGMVAGIAAVGLSTKLFFHDEILPGILPISPLDMWFASLFPPMRLFEFVLGMVLAQIVRRGLFPRIRIPVLLLIWAASWTLAQIVTVPWTYALVAAVPNALTLGAIAHADLRGAKSILTGKLAMWGGNLSYSFFMVQFIVLYWGRSQFDNTYGFGGAILVLLGFLAVTLVAAWILFKCVEQPIMTHLSRPKRKPPQVAAVPTGPRLASTTESKDGLAA